MAVVITQNTLDGSMRAAMLEVEPFDAPVVIEAIVQPFEATRNTDLASLVEASFSGYAQLIASAVANIVHEPISDQWWLIIPDPAGGWGWTRDAGAGDPETIYGCRIAGLGCFLIPPVLMAANGDNCTIGEIHVPIRSPLAS